MQASSKTSLASEQNQKSQLSNNNNNLTPVMSMKGITKTFPGVTALSEISLDLYPRQVTALVGENGAGKSTVVKILTGIYQPTAGSLSIHGQDIKFPTPHDASEAGVTAIHQETVLFDDLSVAENIFIGHAPKTSRGLIDWKTMNAEAEKLLQTIGANIDPNLKLKDLGIANKHMVAISRALSIDASVVIMDEPTAALSHKEIEELYDLVDKLKADGKAILFISHKFDEIFRIADRYTVFRDGEMVDEGHLKDITENDLVEKMVGRSVDQIFPTREPSIGAEILSVVNYCHPTEFSNINFKLHKGEILGFYGLVGAGRSEFMQSLFGITKPASGEVFIEGNPATIRNPAQAIEKGIVYVSEDRGKQGVVTTLPIFQNVSLPSLQHISKKGFLQIAEEFSLAREFTRRLDLRAASLDQHVGDLSGGNQQKVVIAKWLATQPLVIILDEPTKGIDIGSKTVVHEFMAELAAGGLAVIMVSSEIPEILGMTDRTIVMREGLIVNEFGRDEMSPEKLVRAAAGIKEST